ncbi:Protein CBG26320 [Caenorhabditis briggsae]|uniref:Protein CBG26320 n=1 Tax=Caenorhabditis briggsae TaxID=6238 RepID=B6IG93_CAEBR|nr:Protein CBG26320 [Caenorhabditis briggsae]CAR98923.1 Protein CBG26320 [Caenorhabditis briggsae]
MKLGREQCRMEKTLIESFSDSGKPTIRKIRSYERTQTNK